MLFLVALMVLSAFVPTQLGIGEEASAHLELPVSSVAAQLYTGYDFVVEKSWVSSDGTDVSGAASAVDGATVNLSIPFAMMINYSDTTASDYSEKKAMADRTEYAVSDNITANFTYINKEEQYAIIYGMLNVTLSDSWELDAGNLADELYASQVTLYDETTIDDQDLTYSESTTNITTKSSSHSWTTEGSTVTLSVVNTYDIETTDVVANKVWKNADGTTNTETHPTIYFKLYRSIPGGEPEAVEDAELISLPNGTTNATWTDMPVSDNLGNEYTYTVMETDENGEDAVPADYTKTEDGLTVTNTKNEVSTTSSTDLGDSGTVDTGDPDNTYLIAGIGCLAAIAAIGLIWRKRA